MQTIKFTNRPVFMKSLVNATLQLAAYEPLLRIEYPGQKGDAMSDVYVSARKQDDDGVFGSPFVIQMQGRIWDRLAKQAAIAAGANKQRPDSVDGWIFQPLDEGRDVFVMWVG